MPPSYFRFTTPLPIGIPFISVALPEGRTSQPGAHRLSYTINQGGNIFNSEDLVINVDIQPPVPNGAVILPPEVELDGITKPYLDANGFVLVTIPEYGTHKIGDFVEVYYGEYFPGVKFGEFTRLNTTDLVTFELTAAQIGSGEGPRLIFYYITDRKGNRSSVSPEKTVEVALTDPPLGLQAPDVPLFGDGLIDLSDAQNPVGAGIAAEYTNYLPGDEIVLSWDSSPPISVPIPRFPFHVNVPFGDVFNGNPGLKTVNVNYQIKRGRRLYPSPNLSVDVDLRKPGPDIDPTNPGPPNPALDEPILQGAGGNPPNVLTAADSVGDVAVTVRPYDNIKDGDIVQLRYKGSLIPNTDGGVYIVPVTPPVADIPFAVRWNIFQSGGNGNPIPLDYIISHPAVNENVDTSPPQDINVLITPDTVPTPVFQHLDPDFSPVDWLNCNSLRTDGVLGPVVEVLIPADPKLANQTMFFAYQGYTDAAGSNPKLDTNLPFPYTPSAQEASIGFIVKVPYEPFRKTENAYGAIAYMVMINGHPTHSDRHLLRVYMIVPGTGGTCRIPPVV